MQYIKNNLLLIIGIIVGSLAGFFYWKFVGCSSGRCLITSRPVNATIYGAILGGLLFSIFKPNKK
jgi:uncharacterized membrane protein YeaQ/YmgE (transglycosylase-associated protein family)